MTGAIMSAATSSSSASIFAATYVLSPEQLRKWDQDGALHATVPKKKDLLFNPLWRKTIGIDAGDADIQDDQSGSSRADERAVQGLVSHLISQVCRKPSAVALTGKHNLKWFGGRTTAYSTGEVLATLTRDAVYLQCAKRWGSSPGRPVPSNATSIIKRSKPQQRSK